jgi:hypothetical protein
MGRPQRWAHDDDSLRTWIDARLLLSSYVALLGRESRSGIGVLLGLGGGQEQ